jgi:hypothetical protein
MIGIVEFGWVLMQPAAFGAGGDLETCRSEGLAWGFKEALKSCSSEPERGVWNTQFQLEVKKVNAGQIQSITEIPVCGQSYSISIDSFPGCKEVDSRLLLEHLNAIAQSVNQAVTSNKTKEQLEETIKATAKNPSAAEAKVATAGGAEAKAQASINVDLGGGGRVQSIIDPLADKPVVMYLAPDGTTSVVSGVPEAIALHGIRLKDFRAEQERKRQEEQARSVQLQAQGQMYCIPKEKDETVNNIFGKILPSLVTGFVGIYGAVTGHDEVMACIEAKKEANRINRDLGWPTKEDLECGMGSAFGSGLGMGSPFGAGGAGLLGMGYRGMGHGMGGYPSAGGLMGGYPSAGSGPYGYRQVVGPDGRVHLVPTGGGGMGPGGVTGMMGPGVGPSGYRVPGGGGGPAGPGVLMDGSGIANGILGLANGVNGLINGLNFAVSAGDQWGERGIGYPQGPLGGGGRGPGITNTLYPGNTGYPGDGWAARLYPNGVPSFDPNLNAHVYAMPGRAAVAPVPGGGGGGGGGGGWVRGPDGRFVYVPPGGNTGVIPGANPYAQVSLLPGGAVGPSYDPQLAVKQAQLEAERLQQQAKMYEEQARRQQMQAQAEATYRQQIAMIQAQIHENNLTLQEQMAKLQLNYQTAMQTGNFEGLVSAGAQLTVTAGASLDVGPGTSKGLSGTERSYQNPYTHRSPAQPPTIGGPARPAGPPPKQR